MIIYLAMLIVSTLIVLWAFNELALVLWRPVFILVFGALVFWGLTHSVKSIGLVHTPHPGLVFFGLGAVGAVFTCWIAARIARQTYARITGEG